VKWTREDLGKAKLDELVSFIEVGSVTALRLDYDGGVVVIARGALAQEVVAFLEAFQGLMQVTSEGVDELHA